MIPFNELLIFALAALGMVLTPGPNMMYLVSRSICQGRTAGLISLMGVVLGFLFYMFTAALGLTALLFAIPLAYIAIKLTGAAYLLWIAWNTIKPGARAVFEVRDLPEDSRLKLFQMGLFTSLLNPKIAVFYMAILPQFIKPEHGSTLSQSLELGFTQIMVSASVNALIVFTAGTVAAWFSSNPTRIQVQKWIMATVLGGLAVRLALDEARP
jgi:threonine/homoserine/homoserine lactone efflux protein